MKTAARWPSHFVLALLLSVAMHAQTTLDVADYDHYFSPNTLTLNGGECKSSPSAYECHFVEVTDGTRDTSWVYASFYVPTRHGVFKTGTFNIADHTATSWTIDPYTGWSLVVAPCKNSYYCFVGTATDDVIHGSISDLHGHVIYYVDLFIAYSRKHGKRVPYIAPGSTVIRR